VSLLPAVQSLSIPNLSRLVSFDSFGKWNYITFKISPIKNNKLNQTVDNKKIV
jgi:hypothetical protein